MGNYVELLGDDKRWGSESDDNAKHLHNAHRRLNFMIDYCTCYWTFASNYVPAFKLVVTEDICT